MTVTDSNGSAPNGKGQIGQLISLSKIKRDKSIPFRKVDKQTISEYAERMQAGDAFPAIEVVQDSEGNYWPWDYQHRFRAIQKLGKKEIMANVVLGTKNDAKWNYCSANDSHGLRRTNKQKQDAIRTALEMKPNFSDLQIAKQCRVTSPTVAKIRKAMESEKVIEPVVERETKAGTILKNKPTGRPPKPVAATEFTKDNAIALSKISVNVWCDFIKLNDKDTMLAIKKLCWLFKELYQTHPTLR